MRVGCGRATGIEVSEKGGAVWKVYADRDFLLDGP